MIPETLWLVMGTNDEDEDEDDLNHFDWVVACYADEERAKEHQTLAEEYAQSASSMEENWDEKLGDYDVWEDQRSPYDREKCNYEYQSGGLRYYVAVAPLALHVDQYQERFGR